MAWSRSSSRAQNDKPECVQRVAEGAREKGFHERSVAWLSMGKPYIVPPIRSHRWSGNGTTGDCALEPKDREGTSVGAP